MYIRTQNKDALIDISGMAIKVDPRNRNKIIAYSNHCGIEGWEVLGTYSSKEKARKVLDMIQDRYLSSNVVSHGGFVKNTVFQIPDDTEV